ncbi:hypothetical protein JZ751_019176 [Albula glossodonta]|uniref:5-azacytidine-induced protein 1 n=1 Tax=Albula glossodonta TaxID=121402 RepID=A0A8T2N4D9_9TELE|nr:hypothetical protein JZ751_019176 [Albula glossodonta]
MKSTSSYSMHTARSPVPLPVGMAGDGLHLLGSQMSVSRRPSSATPGKHFSRSVSVSVASEGRGKRNTLNLRRSNSTTQVNQRADISVSNILKATAHEEAPAESGSLTKSQKNFSSGSSTSNNNATCSSPAQLRSPAQARSPTLFRRREVTEEEAERRHAKRQRTGEAALKRLLTVKKREREQRVEEVMSPEAVKKKVEDRKRIREEKARLARLAAIEELQQKRAQRAEEVQRIVGEELETLRHTGKVGRKKPTKTSPSNKGGILAADIKAKNTGSVEDQQQGAPCSRPQSKTTLTELLDTLRLLEEEPQPKTYSKEKYAWIDEGGDSNSLTADNLQRHGQLSQIPALPEGGALLSQAKLHSIMSFLDEMEQSEQERPRSVTSASNREVLLSEEELGVAHVGVVQVGVEQASATAAEVTASMMSLKLELEEKKRTVNMLQTALAQQRELTVRHVKETERELTQNLQLQKEQYETTIQRHLAFIDQLIDDKKALSERCETVVSELKQVDQKYTKKIAQMQEQHDLAELLQADERAGQRFVRQTEELRLQMERERDQLCQREREQAQRRQREELEELRKQLEENSSLAGRTLRQELDRTREEQERRHQEAWLLSREREMREEVRRGRDKEIELAIQRLEEETSGAREECERAAENRETEAQLLHLQVLLRHKDQEVQDLSQIRDKLSEERRSLAEVIRQEFADRLVATEEENRRVKVEVSELRARLRLELERVTREKEEELAEVHQRVKSAILKKEETVNSLRKQHEAALKRADHLEALLEQQRKQLLGK